MSETVSSSFKAADAENYERLMGRWSRRLARSFLDFVAPEPGARFLDVGCGTGSLAFLLAERFPDAEVTGVDASDIYIAHARKKAGRGRPAFEVADATALPFAAGSFDGLFSLLMLHFVPRPERAIAEMRRTARPAAPVAAAVWDLRGGLVYNRIFWDTAAALLPEANQQRAINCTRPLTQPGALVAAWRAAGFREVEEAMLTIRTEFADFADYLGPFLGKDGPVAAFIGSLPPEARNQLLAKVKLAYLDGEADGPRSYAATAWAVKGRAP